jgi:hypothetical protein
MLGDYHRICLNPGPLPLAAKEGTRYDLTVTDPLGNITTYTYDVNAKLLSAGGPPIGTILIFRATAPLRLFEGTKGLTFCAESQL